MLCTARFTLVMIICMTGAPALAAPPASCARKFLGTWEHYSNGVMTNRAIVRADGQAPCIETGPKCVSTSTWTCDGDRFLYTTEFGTYTYVYNPAKGTLENGSNVAYRSGKGPNSASAGAAAPVVGLAPAALSKPSATPGGGQPTKGQIPDSCIVMGAPEELSIGCGENKRWWKTRISLAPDCRGYGVVNVKINEPRKGWVPGPALPSTERTCGQGLTRSDVQIIQSRFR